MPSGISRLFKIVSATLLTALGCLWLPVDAQAPSPVVLSNLAPATTPLDGTWKFQTGDDPAWAFSTFDDSAWETIDIARPWGDQGRWAYSGSAWYRRTLQYNGPADASVPLALFIPETTCAYEVYWNGRLIGRTDAMPAPVMLNSSAQQVFPLGPPQSDVLAFRVHTTPLDSTTPGNLLGFNAIPQVGNLNAVRNLAAAEHALILRKRFLHITELLLYGSLFLLALVVWLHQREQKLFFWVAAFLLSSVVWNLFDVTGTLFPWALNFPVLASFVGPTLHSFIDISLWYVLLYLLGFYRNPALVRWTRVLAWLALVGATADAVAFLLPHRDAHVLLFERLDAIATVFFSVPAIYPLILIALAFRKPLDPARRLVAITAFLSDMYFVVAHTAEQGQRFTRWTLADRMTAPLFTIAGVYVTMTAILSLLLALSMVYAVYRYILEQGDRRNSLEQEFHNARAVQQILVPEAHAPTPGYEMHSVYKPFGEVGGDFFQIVPLPNGSALIVIGDVSGKGMPAAMTVALLVGTVRSVAYYDQNPGHIMFAMNLRMVGRSQGGFTTCLILRADPDGTITAANAGHLSPYIAGREVLVETGLPLGIATGVNYPETVFHLPCGEQLTLLTDGIVEARNHACELFGFDRTAALATLSAEAIAETARHFGQDDDITVLTLTRKNIPAASALA